jgi:hypothetical protein
MCVVTYLFSPGKIVNDKRKSLPCARHWCKHSSFSYLFKSYTHAHTLTPTRLIYLELIQLTFGVKVCIYIIACQ